VARAKGSRSEGADLEFFARCASGFEQVLAGELKGLRMRRVRPLRGGVAFFGALEDGYRACLWLRSATRVQLVLARVGATDADELYRAVKAYAWERQVRRGATIAVDAHGENDELRNTKFTALKVKDALCDRLRERVGWRPDVDSHDPDLSVNVALHREKATLYLNLSGASLHRRGYRADGVQTEAPLKETLAAGLLLAAGWPDLAREGGVLVDPMCGSGTLAIEGALMAAGIAPGLLRERWGFEGWQGHDQALWDRVREAPEAGGVAEHCAALILASDLDAGAISIARDNAERAGVAHLVRFSVDDAARLARHLRGRRIEQAPGGLLVANPPYGQRLLSKDELPKVNAALRAAVEALPAGWSTALITPDGGVDTALGMAPDELIACYNGPIKAWVRIYRHGGGERRSCEVVSLAGVRRSVPVVDASSEQYAARLRKVARESVRWARRNQVSCVRVYDADLPDYALSVDLYLSDDASGSHVVVEERRRPGSVDELRATHRFADAVALTGAIMDVPSEHVVSRPWQAEADRRPAGTPARRLVPAYEDGCRFEVDLEGKPDTGLPLALRGVREQVGALSKRARYLGLFAASAATAVHAARGGARRTTTVCAYPDRIEWAERALAENGFAGAAHACVCEDVGGWVSERRKAGSSFDVIACTPPAWLPAPRPGASDFELRRDHVDLIRQVAALLARGGTLVFACEDKGFKLDEGALLKAGLTVEDAGARTLAHGFERRANEHHCYLVRRA
jgi:23S rRNA (guanine2445-N2)-methyltransferase / 23S rRNA (guanine2069-N7)-methyltransferase